MCRKILALIRRQWMIEGQLGLLNIFHNLSQKSNTAFCLVERWTPNAVHSEYISVSSEYISVLPLPSQKRLANVGRIMAQM